MIHVYHRLLVVRTCISIKKMALSSLNQPEPMVGKEESTDQTPKDDKVKTRAKVKRVFNFNLWKKRHVAFQIAYVGWDYSGFARQKITEKTIEAELFKCFTKTKLIEDLDSCNYSRCGRTDTGVSALGQVISAHVRSNLLEGHGIVPESGSEAAERKGDKTEELSYLTMMNGSLPEEIRVLAWSPVDADFSARFSCLARVYKYFFPIGSMDLQVLQEAAQRFVGSHDFRNFCKADRTYANTNYVRTILSFDVTPLDQSPVSPRKMYQLVVTGKSFLWHQVRCMAAILFLVGSGLEQPSVINHMLEGKRKPQYGMAAEFPLVLYEGVFDNMKWQRDEVSHQKLITHFQRLWTKYEAQAAILSTMADSLTHLLTSAGAVAPIQYMRPLLRSDHLLGGAYKPLLDRNMADTIEDRLEARAKRRKLEEEKLADDDDGEERCES